MKEGLAPVKLPSDLKVYHNATGVKEDSRQAYNILEEYASYGETAVN